MVSKDPAAIRRQSIQFLRDVSKILRNLATEIENAIESEQRVDIPSIQKVARELHVNHDTLLMLTNVNQRLGQVQPRLN